MMKFISVLIVGTLIVSSGIYSLQLAHLFDFTVQGAMAFTGAIQGTIVGLFPFKEIMKG